MIVRFRFVKCILNQKYKYGSGNRNIHGCKSLQITPTCIVRYEYSRDIVRTYTYWYSYERCAHHLAAAVLSSQRYVTPRDVIVCTTSSVTITWTADLDKGSRECRATHCILRVAKSAISCVLVSMDEPGSVGQAGATRRRRRRWQWQCRDRTQQDSGLRTFSNPSVEETRSYFLSPLMASIRGEVYDIDLRQDTC